MIVGSLGTGVLSHAYLLPVGQKNVVLTVSQAIPVLTVSQAIPVSSE
jgi:hypothetical protein